MLVKQLEGLCANEPSLRDFQQKPQHFEAYMNLLQGEQFTMGPCFLVPAEAASSSQVVSITRENGMEFLRGSFEWLIEEIDYAQPCVAFICENRAVSICRSVRITSRAHEAGLETLDEFRGRGYAAAVVAGWAMEVRKMGGIPLYSTFWGNLASQSVARKLALSFYGANFTVY
jgi:GNAT superfamily N-acetyltransferase